MIANKGYLRPYAGICAALVRIPRREDGSVWFALQREYAAFREATDLAHAAWCVGGRAEESARQEATTTVAEPSLGVERRVH